MTPMVALQSPQMMRLSTHDVAIHNTISSIAVHLVQVVSGY